MISKKEGNLLKSYFINMMNKKTIRKAISLSAVGAPIIAATTLISAEATSTDEITTRQNTINNIIANTKKELDKYPGLADRAFFDKYLAEVEMINNKEVYTKTLEEQLKSEKDYTGKEDELAADLEAKYKEKLELAFGVGTILESIVPLQAVYDEISNDLDTYGPNFASVKLLKSSSNKYLSEFKKTIILQTGLGVPYRVDTNAQGEKESSALVDARYARAFTEQFKNNVNKIKLGASIKRMQTILFESDAEEFKKLQDNNTTSESSITTPASLLAAWEAVEAFKNTQLTSNIDPLNASMFLSDKYVELNVDKTNILTSLTQLLYLTRLAEDYTKGLELTEEYKNAYNKALATSEAFKNSQTLTIKEEGKEDQVVEWGKINTNLTDADADVDSLEEYLNELYKAVNPQEDSSTPTDQDTLVSIRTQINTLCEMMLRTKYKKNILAADQVLPRLDDDANYPNSVPFKETINSAYKVNYVNAYDNTDFNKTIGTDREVSVIVDEFIPSNTALSENFATTNEAVAQALTLLNTEVNAFEEGFAPIKETKVVFTTEDQKTFDAIKKLLENKDIIKLSEITQFAPKIAGLTKYANSYEKLDAKVKDIEANKPELVSSNAFKNGPLKAAKDELQNPQRTSKSLDDMLLVLDAQLNNEDVYLTLNKANALLPRLDTENAKAIKDELAAKVKELEDSIIKNKGFNPASDQTKYEALSPIIQKGEKFMSDLHDEAIQKLNEAKAISNKSTRLEKYIAMLEEVIAMPAAKASQYEQNINEVQNSIDMNDKDLIFNDFYKKLQTYISATTSDKNTFILNPKGEKTLKDEYKTLAKDFKEEDKNAINMIFEEIDKAFELNDAINNYLNTSVNEFNYDEIVVNVKEIKANALKAKINPNKPIDFGIEDLNKGIDVLGVKLDKIMDIVNDIQVNKQSLLDQDVESIKTQLPQAVTFARTLNDNDYYGYLLATRKEYKYREKSDKLNEILNLEKNQGAPTLFVSALETRVDEALRTSHWWVWLYIGSIIAAISGFILIISKAKKKQK
ncbi:hypothetical protein H9M94_00795 [Mycoplasma sp. Pen4]|uniref:hypothetical protein n=1 Tax=Mycoplasma sp. Pen4 TaxID=640330 RepID=UPI0016549629|nr:hypothetical protein [Mycoplasma sp. Pen4]QNM93799.1 hypothetical protein H9M94_00795 [Mycoplasma sp. Pen4]